jgi:hypothetical protein
MRSDCVPFRSPPMGWIVMLLGGRATGPSLTGQGGDVDGLAAPLPSLARAPVEVASFDAPGLPPQVYPP